MSCHDQAFSLLHKALRLAPEDPGAHMMLGEVCLEKGDYSQALQEFDKKQRLESTKA